MIYPTLEELSKGGKYNRYTVTVAAAKGARMVTEEYCAERAAAEELVARKETDKTLSALIDKELRDEKAVRTAVHRFLPKDGKEAEFVIVDSREQTEENAGTAEAETTERETAEAETVEDETGATEEESPKDDTTGE